jgi:hypothetical protein
MFLFLNFVRSRGTGRSFVNPATFHTQTLLAMRPGQFKFINGRHSIDYDFSQVTNGKRPTLYLNEYLGTRNLAHLAATQNQPTTKAAKRAK